MTRVRLRRPDQPFFVQVSLAGLEFLASLRLAVVLLTLLILVLAVATFIETSYGAAAARFSVYRAWWFTLLGGLLGINVLCAAVVRFPWRRHQTGFVMTHAGIIILLLGSFWTARRGIDAQLSIYEGMIGHTAYEETLHFEIDITKNRPGEAGETSQRTGAGESQGSQQANSQVLRTTIPFRSGPFNWCDYTSSLRYLLWAPPGRLPVLPWQLARRDRGIVFSSHDFRLEVLDYYSDSRRIKGGYLSGYVRIKAFGSQKISWLSQWQPIELELHPRHDNDQGATTPTTIGTRVTLSDGTRVVFTAALTQFELDGFLLGTPVTPLDEEGQVVLVHNRVRYVLPVRDLQTGKGEIPLKGSNLRITHFEKDARLQAVQLRIENNEGVQDEVILFADLPEFNRQGQKLRVAGSYWVDFRKVLSQSEKALILDPRATTGATRPRIDLCQGPDGKLYYRLWKAAEVVNVGNVRVDGNVSALLSENDMDVRLMVNTFVPLNTANPTAETIVPLPFRKGVRMTEPRVKVRLVADSKAFETWLAVIPKGANHPVTPEEIAAIEEQSAHMRVTIKHDSVDVGFRLKLLEFQRKLDPGTNQPSHYASLVDLYVPKRILQNRPFDNALLKTEVTVDPSDQEPLQLVHSRLLITLNHPANIVDPVTGRSYRLYQESFSGPFRPGDPVYEQIVGAQKGPPELYASTLSVNYDPGRGLKYAGSLLIVGGIVVMYLMRVYMFRPRATQGAVLKQANQDLGPRVLDVT